jgi:uncharacterized membrane protein YvbJ
VSEWQLSTQPVEVPSEDTNPSRHLRQQTSAAAAGLANTHIREHLALKHIVLLMIIALPIVFVCICFFFAANESREARRNKLLSKYASISAKW